MMKTILANLAGDSSDHTVLEAAFGAAKIDGGHVRCLHTRFDPMETAALYGAVAPHRLGAWHEVVKEIENDEGTKSAHARAAFEEFCKRHTLPVSEEPASGLSVSWGEVRGTSEDPYKNARYYDLVVMARDPKWGTGIIESALMQVGRPILIAPPKPVEIIGRKVAFAWKEGPEAARTLTAVSGVLSRAERVMILCISENAGTVDTDRESAQYLAKQLRWHGIQAEVRMDRQTTGSAAAKIKDMAYENDADLLVMGAYGHSRLREFVFGGVTYDMLSECAIPVLMFH